MRQIFIFSDKYYDVLAAALPESSHGRMGHMDFIAVPDNTKTIIILTEIADEAMGAKHAPSRIHAEFSSFLAKNDYIHFDAFIGVCLEGLDETELCTGDGRSGGLD